MPRGKKTNIPAQTPALETSAAPPAQNKTKIDTYLTQVRNLCRARGLQIWNKQSLSDLIYQDLLFLYHVPRLCRDGILTLDIDFIGYGKITELSFKALLSLKEIDHINAAFRRLWTQLQRTEVKALFVGREFAMFPIEKNAKTQKKYYDLLSDLLTYSASIDLETYDSNAGYTYFKKGLNKGTAKVFGQFYTPPSVQKSVVAQLNLTLTDIVLDPTCGSCSFIQESAKDLIERFKVSPKVAFKNLRGIEVEPNIYTEGIMNMFINFGILPDMEHNIREADAFIALLDSDTKVDKVVANPPFGADATTFFEHYFTTTTVQKGKREVKTKVINPQVKVQIPHTNTKESAILFFQIIVQKLKDGGKAGVVMNGSIFNDAHSEMIHWFLETCNLTKIIINPSGTFKDQGTNIETYSFIFTKGTPTKSIGIVMLGAENNTVRTLTYEDVKSAGWRIKVKEEEVKEVYSGIYNTVKLGSLYTRPSSVRKFNSGDMDNNGTIPFYNGIWDSPKGLHSENSYTSDVNYFVGIKDGGGDHTSHMVGMGKLFKITGPCAVTSHNFILVPKSKCLIEYQYVHYYMTLNIKFLRDKAKYSGSLGSLSIEDIENYPVVLPPLIIQELIVANLDRIFANPIDMTDTLAFTPRAMDLMLKDPTGATLEDVISGLRQKRAYLTSADSLKAQMGAVMRSIAARGYEQNIIQEVCDYKNGSTLDKAEKSEEGEFNVMGGGMAYVGKYNKFNREGYTITISKSGASAGFVKEHNGKFWAGDCFSIYPKSDSLDQKYLYYILKLDPKITTSKITGSTIPHCKWSDIADSLICVPPLSTQQEVLTMLSAMEAERATLEQMAAKGEERAKYILDNYLSSVP